MSGLILRLAGPLQSWGEHSTFTDRDTVAFPTRSGLVGLLAGAVGLRRGEPLTRFDPLGFTVRVDAPGVPLTDFHTVGGGLPAARTAPIADGKHRSGETGTIVSRRRYLSDAAFTVAVTGPDILVAELGEALREPRWQPYLGRRSCPPDQPLLLHAGVNDPEEHLRTLVPLPRRRRRLRTTPPDTTVDLILETDPLDPTATTELADMPISFAGLDRRYQRRTVRRETLTLPDTLFAADGPAFQRALYAYMREQP
ncbi:MULTISPECIES: type I-E CRISPR-associated protein Cas5/CasD [unclassified Frankia]